jgi:predicted acylesterase/phospholipase RssA
MTGEPTETTKPTAFRVLALDGGGSKGVYTIGVLREVEALVKKPLAQVFDIIYGTSTGAIIASALSLGLSVDEIEKLYMAQIPKIMRPFFAHGRSQELGSSLRAVFGDKSFGDCLCGLGVVATEYNEKRPVIFKSKLAMAHGMRDTFVPGFGCLIRDAVEASCSAYPFFKVKAVKPSNHARLCLVDGGFSANNPTLLAYVDALSCRPDAATPIKVLSVGVGQYPQRTPWRAIASAWNLAVAVGQIELQFSASGTTLAKATELAARVGGAKIMRIDDSFTEPNLAASLLEHDIERLERLRNKGRLSFGAAEAGIREIVT